MTKKQTEEKKYVFCYQRTSCILDKYGAALSGLIFVLFLYREYQNINYNIIEKYYH
jgi:hypothetical protein